MGMTRLDKQFTTELVKRPAELLPMKAELRKVIAKEPGDTVAVVLTERL